MAHLLHIDSSPRGDRSRSRQLTKEFVEVWQQAHPADVVTYRDVGRNPVPHVDELWIAAAYTPPTQRSAELQAAIHISDQLIDEFLAADLYIMGVPMYNFSIPSPLKAYIDQIVRPGRTFSINSEDPDNPYQPLALGKRMFIITARGGTDYGSGERNAKLNHQDPYLRTIFGFIGITDITFVSVEHDESGNHRLTESIAAARMQISQLIGK